MHSDSHFDQMSIDLDRICFSVLFTLVFLFSFVEYYLRVKKCSRLDLVVTTKALCLSLSFSVQRTVNVLEFVMSYPISAEIGSKPFRYLWKKFKQMLPSNLTIDF